MNNRAIEVLKVLRDEVSTLKDQQLVKAGVHSAIFVAVENGLIEFVVEIIKSHPLLLWVRNANGESIIKAAVVHRQEKIFNLIHGMGGQKTRLVGGRDKFGNNILHLAARLATASQLDRVAGAALQMQRELQCLRSGLINEVERIVNPKYLEEKNDDGKVPRTLFTEEHKHLVKEGEKWMKDTAAACIPVFYRHKAFMGFIISDTLTLYSATTAVLMFLYILTSRYAEGRFLEILPKRLIIGLASLFFSIASAFGATLYLTLSHGLEWVAIPLSLLAAVPVSLYA
ncbi:hypothetical protein CK203_011293 [Vitis vinifera]|uniref:PGG domain-containing protein n=1 Tax=Vitis vinifera TaxID=29760 RepID=A0A438JZ80_VITVI|nr:hypothetical protein CK203_011293 [Vitis vinifera]